MTNEQTTVPACPLSHWERYKYLVNARNYHYSQFNIWMIFFLAIIGALLVAYSTLSSANNDLFSEKILVSVFGYILSMLFHLSSKGYYYWITNWIKLIIEHENKYMSDNSDRVYSRFVETEENSSYWCPIKGANISTSKIVCFLSYLFTFAFGILFVHNLEQFTHRDAFWLDSAITIYAIIKIFILIILIPIANLLFCYLAKKIHSNLNNHQCSKIPLNNGAQNDKV